MLAILDKSPFKSACSKAERLPVGHVTVLEHLHVSIGFKSFHLRWVPHLLTNDLWQKRKEYTSAMLPFVYTAQSDGWHHLVTCDESWFFFNTSPHRMWILSRNDMATKTRFDIQGKKFMFAIIWTPTGFCVVDRFPNDIKMNSAYFVTNLHIPLEQAIFPWGRAPHQKQFVIYVDNCSVHTSRASRDWLEEYDMLRMPKPLYLINLASSNFYLFPTVRKKLERTRVVDKDQVFESVHTILRGNDQ
jgi:hypothetical protein